ncbi:hypothetical protein [Acidisarcina polymorpha]|uniref:hypothetical protein n=1 Tax=Acidisarcina polymorpha TaxID=2211140 RepID=UPI0039C85B28
MLLDRPGKDFFDDHRFDPILAWLDELRVPIYIHPGISTSTDPTALLWQPQERSYRTTLALRLGLAQ